MMLSSATFQSLLPWTHLFFAFTAGLFGALIGSFLNVVIYRVPLGMSVNEPKRSFCPMCKAPIPMWRNVPIVSWLWLRGKCGDCKAPIPFRYVAVEILTCALFVAVWKVFPPQAAPFVMGLMALLVAITWIDAAHMIIPTPLTWIATGLGLAACGMWPQLPVLAGVAGDWKHGLLQSGIGWAAGFFGLFAVVHLGKLALGKKEVSWPKPVTWKLVEPDNETDPLRFVIDGEAHDWWDLFNRPSDRLIVECTALRVDESEVQAGLLTIRELGIELPDGRSIALENLKALAGEATKTTIPREAMGSGDPYLLGAIGAFCGWTGVLFCVFASSIYALIAALFCRIGFGRPLPYGPFLALAAATWLFGGWRLWQWYMEMIGF